ncbi:unnamed protein product [Medioppia subpectinata]|uniref:Caspase family p20 domain-containing protein n=1 Tax=Medioppia subpectinata TaxID=1979941 RepID=A0A7R9KJC4_9ACAR|nr:unnamed protein product [Medioppia subpectinata]CAG2104460.1 unnamed protein product [Medioppia subpectinata]
MGADKPWKQRPECEGTSHLKKDANPKGRVIIFVTLPELANEAERFKSIFTQLLFKSDVYSGLTCDEIKNKLTEVANTDTYNGDAFIMMFIGNGFNEHIIGRTDTSQWPPNECDIMAFSEIVATFAWTRAPALRHKTKQLSPKIEMVADFMGPIESSLINKLKMLDPKFDFDNTQTHVIYACREGFRINPYTDVPGPIGSVSLFGQAFSHTIAQYSAYNSLTEMLAMTLNRMETDLMDKDFKQRPEIETFNATTLDQFSHYRRCILSQYTSK